ncbi:MAG: hypothetical protein WKF39_13780, partial [Aeromicrobium sp.]
EEPPPPPPPPPPPVEEPLVVQKQDPPPVENDSPVVEVEKKDPPVDDDKNKPKDDEEEEVDGQVVVCKFTTTPSGVLTNIIIVSASSLGEGFIGEFPFDFDDAQGSFALRFAADGEKAKDISTDACGEDPPPPFDECPDIDGDQPEGTDCDEGEENGQQVVVCKFTTTPSGVLTNIIIVSASSLGEGFIGEFPFDFDDAQGSFALRFAADGEQAKDISIAVCDDDPPPPFDACPDIDGDQPRGTDCTVVIKDPKVVVCKFTGTPPGVFSHIIIVSASTLGKDFVGKFPFDFPDAQDSFAFRFAAEGEQAKDVSTAACIDDDDGGKDPVKNPRVLDTDPVIREQKLLPDTGGLPLWMLLVAGPMTAAGLLVLMRRRPVDYAFTSGGGPAYSYSLSLPPVTKAVPTPVETVPVRGFLASLVAAVRSFFGGGRR